MTATKANQTPDQTGSRAASTVPFKPASIGSISHGTLRTVDLFDSFGSELEWQIQRNGDFLSRPENFGERDRLNNILGEWQDFYNADGSFSENDDAEIFLNETLYDALQTFAPAYCYFGAHEGDGADFGFWPSWDSINELPQVDDNSAEAIAVEQSDDYSTDVRYVNDHGNVTVYGADGSVLLEVV